MKEVSAKIHGENAVTKMPKPRIKPDRRSRGRWKTVMRMTVFVAVATGGSNIVSAEGIEVRGAGCIGPCSDGACCSGWIKLNPDGVGFARNFVCADYMKTASEKGRAWVCQQLRKKNDVCQKIAGLCSETSACSRQFKNCREAEKYIERARTDESVEVGDAYSYIKPTLGKSKVLKLADGSFKAAVAVTWTLDDENTKMTLPDWCWPNMTDAERAELKRFTDAIKGHEDGHVKVTKDFGKKISNTLSAIGTTEDDAMSNLQTQLEKYQKESGEKLDDQSKLYDEKTDHGAKQSLGPQFGFPGGKDAVLTCP